MQKKVLLPLVILLVAGVGLFFLMKNSGLVTYEQSETNENSLNENGEPMDVSTDIIWNAYSLNGVPFIYPSDWTFEEVRAASGTTASASKVTGFKVTYPISSNSFDNIEAGGACPQVTIPEIKNACVGGIWLHTQSENPVVLKVFEDMKKFGARQTTESSNVPPVIDPAIGPPLTP